MTAPTPTTTVTLDFRDLRPRQAVLAFLEQEGAGAAEGALVTREEITAATGVSRSTIGRLLLRLREEGDVTTERTRRPEGPWGPLRIHLRHERKPQ